MAMADLVVQMFKQSPSLSERFSTKGCSWNHRTKLGQTTQDLEFEVDRTEEQYEQEEEEGGDEGVDEEILQAHDIGSREEPECWIGWVQCSTRHVKSTFKTNC